MRILGCCVLLVLFASCGQLNAAKLTPEQYEEFVRLGSRPAVPETEAAIVAKFGQPERVTRK